MTENQLEGYIKIAIREADKAIKQGNAPFGAVAIDDTGVIAKAHNTVTSSCDPTAHAEINLLRKIAKKTGRVKFDGISVFMNSECCSMCASALIRSGIISIYYGSDQEKQQSLYIPLEDIAAQSGKKIKIVSGILKEKCFEQVRKGRETLKKG